MIPRRPRYTASSTSNSGSSSGPDTYTWATSGEFYIPPGTGWAVTGYLNLNIGAGVSGDITLALDSTDDTYTALAVRAHQARAGTNSDHYLAQEYGGPTDASTLTLIGISTAPDIGDTLVISFVGTIRNGASTGNAYWNVTLDGSVSYVSPAELNAWTFVLLRPAQPFVPGDPSSIGNHSSGSSGGGDAT